ncbi:hypothetical protein DFH28DRAFT_1088422 [Melampsora americana]|nr:hypothetical protein DFH28DRAFT_1088422 [Melampsora americana]
MSSCPAGWVHETYSHPGWLPLITDRVGNYIGVDLSPPMILDPDQDLAKSFHSNQNIIGGGQGNSQASVGQVIAFGREIDEKVVLWNGDGEEGWGKWLSSFADDLEEGQFSILGKRHGSNSKDRFSNRGESNQTQASVRREDHEKGWKDEIEEDQEEEEEEDGIGELGYFHDGFDSTDDSKEFKTWKLLNQYRGMNVIEALCLRSKQRWSEIGLYSSRSPLRTDQNQPSIPSQPTPGPSNSNLTHSPHQHPPPGFASGSHASLPSQPDTPIAFVTPPSPRQSIDQIGRPEASTSQNLNVIPPSHKVRKRTVPPPPTSLSLPTMDDMIQAGSLESNVEDEEGIGLEEGGKEVRMENEGRGRMLGLGRNELIGMSRIKKDERKIENEV